MGITIVFILLFFITVLLRNCTYRRKNFPPGPISFPLLGNYINLLFVRDTKMCDQFIHYGKKYSKIFSFTFGAFPGIVITDPKLAKEAVCNKVFNGRPKVETVLIGYKGLLRGLVCQDDHNWKILRSFTFKTLTKLGLGKTSMQSILDVEISCLVEEMKTEAGLPISTKGKFSLPLLNLLWQTIGGERLEASDDRVLKVLQAIHGGTEPSLVSSLIFIPWVTRWFPKLVGWDVFKKLGECTYDFINSFVEERLANPSTSQSNDFVGLFLKEIKQTTDTSSCFYGDLGKENLVATLVDVFVASTETCSTTLSWMFLYLALNPEKQENLTREIVRVVGREKPKLDDAGRMPYTEAVIMETMRLGSVLPMNLFHCALEDTSVGTWTIPKGTLMSASIYAVHHDPDTWGDPEEFRPERFISKNECVTYHPAYMPFSAGPRICPGISFAKEAMFTFLVTILQSFVVTWDHSERKPSTDAKLSVIRMPIDHKLIFRERVC